MRPAPETAGSALIEARGFNAAKTITSFWRSRRKPWNDPFALPYQDKAGPFVWVIAASAVIEIVVTDLIIPWLWLRIVIGVLEVALFFVLMSLFAGLRVYPHRVTAQELEINYGATFELRIPRESIGEVGHRREMTGQTKSAEVTDGILRVPFMGESNVVVRLNGPVLVRLRRSSPVEVREIRLFTTDPEAGVRRFHAKPVPGPPRAAKGPATPWAPRWIRALRLLALLVLAVEIVLVTTGVLDWRTAAAVLVVTEGTLGIIGLVAGTTIIRHYRLARAEGSPRGESLITGLRTVLPEQLVTAVIKELGFLRVLGLLLSRRIEGARPTDVAIPYGRRSRRLRLAAGFVLFLVGALVLSRSEGRTPWLVVGLVPIYAGLVTVVVGLASRVRPHLLRPGTPAQLSLRWGVGSEVSVQLASVREFAFVHGEKTDGRTLQKDPGGYRFEAPGPLSQRVVLEFREPVTVPTIMGLTRPATALSVPVDDVVATEALLRPRLEAAAHNDLPVEDSDR